MSRSQNAWKMAARPRASNVEPIYRPIHSTARGQSAVETLVTVGIALAFIVPMVLIFFSSTGIRTQTLAQVQARGLAQQMADTAGEVWYQGNGSKKIALLSYPDRLLNISLGGDMLVDDAGKAAPCPPANPGRYTISDSLNNTQLHQASREIILTLDNGQSGTTQAVAVGPAMVCNAYGGVPARRLDYVPGKALGGPLSSGLVMLVFENKGDYVSITRA
jgi:hypothetical protein